jgi:L-asparaginase II
MDGPFQVEVTRGSVVEAVHTVHAVAVADGRVVASAGDAQLLTFLRSSAKPIQALPLVRSRPDVGDREIAIACASHRALPEQLDAVRSLLALAPATEDELETGPAPTPIEHNCSGKHAGFLAVCKARGLATNGYRFPEHPLQRELLEEIAATAGVAVADVPVAIDGCGVPTFALTLERSAHLFAALPRLDGGARVVAAMLARPELLRGPVAADVKLIRTLPGWVAKGGAEGLFCAVSGDGLAVVAKVEDGSFRAILPAIAAFLESLQIGTGELGVVPVENSHGERVGVVRIRR